MTIWLVNLVERNEGHHILDVVDSLDKAQSLKAVYEDDSAKKNIKNTTTYYEIEEWDVK